MDAADRPRHFGGLQAVSPDRAMRLLRDANYPGFYTVNTRSPGTDDQVKAEFDALRQIAGDLEWFAWFFRPGGDALGRGDCGRWSSSRLRLAPGSDLPNQTDFSPWQGNATGVAVASRVAHAAADTVNQPGLDFYMRQLFAIGLSSLVWASFATGCTPNIPVKDDFGTSALKPTGNIPPEFAEFNNYDPSVNPLLAQQSCATPYIPLADKSLRASPGELVAETGRCQPYEITIGNLREHFFP